MTEINNILKERGNRYGEYRDNADLSQTLKYDLAHFIGYENLDTFHKEALDNICQKMARIVNGDPNYIENWKDICGYSQLVINELLTTEGATDGKVIKLIVKNGKLVLNEINKSN